MSELIYPQHPGAKVAGTSQAAAEAMAEHAPTLRERCLELLHGHTDLTTDEAADLLNVSVLAVRPRFSELRRMGKIVQTGERRTNASGLTANVWRVAPVYPVMQPELL